MKQIAIVKDESGTVSLSCWQGLCAKNILYFVKKSKQITEIDSKPKKLLFHLFYEVKLIISSLLNKIGYPPIISKIEMQDDVIGSKIKIEASKHWTKISIGNRDFYFYRITGKFAGTGCSTCR